MPRFLLAVILTIAWQAGCAQAEEPAKEDKKETDKFTAPAPEVVPVLPYYLRSSLPQPGTREVWQYYGVDSRGRWVARVIQSPYGSYYYHNGAPFYYTTTQSNLYMPYVVD